MKPRDVPPVAYERLRAAQPLPTSQEVADGLGVAHDAVCDVLDLLEEDHKSESLEAFKWLLRDLAREFQCRLASSLQRLPDPTESPRHKVPDDFDGDLPIPDFDGGLY